MTDTKNGCKEANPSKAIAQNGQFGSKIKNTKNMQKTILLEH